MSKLKSESRWLVPFITIAALAILSGWGLTRVGAAPPHGNLAFLVLAATAVMVWGGAKLVWWLCRLALIEKEPRPLRRLTRTAIRDAAEDMLVRFGPVLLVPIFSLWFGVLKGFVPAFGGFRFDGVLAALDHALFFGDPWRITHGLFGQFTPAIDWMYQAWLAVILFSAFLVAALGQSELRARFFLSWVLGWTLLGVVGAIALASAGPIFAEDFGLAEAHRFAGLLERLRATDAALGGSEADPVLGALRARNYLLELYYAQQTGIGGGISAAPSMHVAITTLVFLTARRVGRLIAIPAALYLALICVGSVHLAWHYAIDGIISIIGMIIIWKLVGAWLNAHPGRPSEVRRVLAR